MPKKSQPNPAVPSSLPEPIAQPVWNSACAYHQAQKEYDRLKRELDRAAIVLNAANENLSSTLKNHGVGSVVIEMNATDRLVAVFDHSRNLVRSTLEAAFEVVQIN
jgi:hypothetical protein